MRQSLLLLAATMLVLPVTASAQWVFEENFPPDVDRQFSSAHGVAVDPDGKIWVQYFSATDSVQVPEFVGNDPAGRDGYRDIRELFVFNADGTEATISPVQFIDLPGGARDTLGGFLRRDDTTNELVWEGKSNRGLRTAPDGNILVSSFNTLYKLDYQTGAGLAKNIFDDYCALTQATADDNGTVYVAPVCPGPPIRALSGMDLSFIENVTDVSSNFSRGVIVAPDGLSFFETDYENPYTIIHQRADEFSPWDSVGVSLRGMRTESAAFNPLTGLLWASAGNPLNPPNEDPTVTTNWQSATWYAFAMTDVLLNEVPTPLDSLTWNNQTDGRPRGIAFSPDGLTAYVAQFNEPEPSLQKFVSPVNPAVEPGAPGVPDAYTLEQNYPNPFSGATTIAFGLRQAGHALIRVYDTLGREVAVLAGETLPAGNYTVPFEAGELAAGTYLYVMELDGQRVSRTMQIVR